MCHLIFLLPVFGLYIFWLWPLSVALPVYLLVLIGSLWFDYYTIKAMRWQVVVGPEAVIHRRGKVVEKTQFDTWVVVQGERWIARSRDELNLGDAIYVVGIEGLTLDVRRGVQTGNRISTRRPGQRSLSRGRELSAGQPSPLSRSKVGRSLR